MFIFLPINDTNYIFYKIICSRVMCFYVILGKYIYVNLCVMQLKGMIYISTLSVAGSTPFFRATTIVYVKTLFNPKLEP